MVVANNNIKTFLNCCYIVDGLYFKRKNVKSKFSSKVKLKIKDGSKKSLWAERFKTTSYSYWFVLECHLRKDDKNFTINLWCFSLFLVQRREAKILFLYFSIFINIHCQNTTQCMYKKYFFIDRKSCRELFTTFFLLWFLHIAGLSGFNTE